jgi:hypothetical protein
VTTRWPRSASGRSSPAGDIAAYLAEHPPPPTWERAKWAAWCAAADAWCEQVGVDDVEFARRIPDEPFDPEVSL